MFLGSHGGQVADPMIEAIFITSAIIKARATCGSFLRSAKTQCVKAQFGVVNGSGGS